MSDGASAENLSTDAQSDGGSMCLELALEGKRLCKAGDCRAGVAFFQAAIQAGTDDLQTLSVIYNHLGNAYFNLGDCNRAMQYHKKDLTLARTMNDNLGEAKASGNLGITLKVMGKFTEAIQCCKRHLEISRSLGDRLSEGKALYNLGKVYHAQGKQLGRVGQNEPGYFPQEVQDCLLQAVSYYDENLDLMRSLEDRQAMGRACGNLGKTCFLLGEFPRAIRYYTESLRIAREFGDRPAERRANSNLAHFHFFSEQFENAAEYYKRTLDLSEESGDAAAEAQACYCLGNTYTLLGEYRAAEQYHARHLAAARKLRDRVGEGGACRSLGNAHAALGNHEKELYHENEHHIISKEIADVLGVATARMNISDLHKVLGLPAEQAPVPCAGPALPGDSAPRTPFNALRVRRQSMEQLSSIQVTPDAKSKCKGVSEQAESPVESFLDLVSRCQAARISEQRATLALHHDKENRLQLQRSHSSGNKHSSSNGVFVELLCGLWSLWSQIQSDRIDSQRAELAPPAKKKAKVAPTPAGNCNHQTTFTQPYRDFIGLLARVQGSRIDDQRAVLPTPEPGRSVSGPVIDENFLENFLDSNQPSTSGGNTNVDIVTDDDLIDLENRDPVRIAPKCRGTFVILANTDTIIIDDSLESLDTTRLLSSVKKVKREFEEKKPIKLDQTQLEPLKKGLTDKTNTMSRRAMLNCGKARLIKPVAGKALPVACKALPVAGKAPPFRRPGTVPPAKGSSLSRIPIRRNVQGK